MGRSFRIERLAAGPMRLLAACALLTLPLGSCRDLSTVMDVVFPSTVPGLPADQPWTSLPVRRWLTESGIEPAAISACLAPECREPAAVGLFRARGRDAVILQRAARDPAALVAALSKRKAPLRPARRRQAPVKARITAEPAQEGGTPGFVIRLARPDGSRAAAGYAVAVERQDVVTALVIVAATEAGARAIARSVIPQLR